MQQTQACIDFANNTLSICDDLVVEPLVPNKLPTNVIRVASNCTIPPQSEAVIAMISDKSYQGQFLLTPLPTVYNKQVSLAHAIVAINNRKTQCRILSPTNAPVTLTKWTSLATISPISNNQIFKYDKSKTKQMPLKIDYDNQLKTLTDLGIEVSAADYTQTQREQLVAFLYNNRDLFATDLSDLPSTHMVTHTIDTGDAAPIRQHAYRHSREARKIIDEEVTKLLKADIIEESNSPLASPVVLVKKKGGGHQLCVDMRKVNTVTKPTFSPLPLQEDVFQLASENNATIFSVCDFLSGFFQIHIDEASRPTTAFITHKK